MRIVRTEWYQRLFPRNDAERYKIKIVLFASEKEIDELRKMEYDAIAQTIFKGGENKA
jgi:hypothetical protein